MCNWVRQGPSYSKIKIYLGNWIPFIEIQIRWRIYSLIKSIFEVVRKMKIMGIIPTSLASPNFKNNFQICSNQLRRICMILQYYQRCMFTQLMIQNCLYGLHYSFGASEGFIKRYNSFLFSFLVFDFFYINKCQSSLNCLNHKKCDCQQI